MSLEQLSPENLNEQVKNRRNELNLLLTKKLRNLKTSPEGRLRVAQAHKGHKLQYFHITKRGDTKGSYIPHAQIALAKRLAQKQYDQALIKLLRSQIKAFNSFSKMLENSIYKLYEKQCPARRSLITPAILTNEQYAELWQKVSWQGHSFSPEQKTYSTSRHELVRSKSEVIIADTLARHGIPYRYEYPLELKIKRPVGDGNSTDSNSAGSHSAAFYSDNYFQTNQPAPDISANSNIADHIANTDHTPSIQESRTNRPATSRTVYPDFLCLNLRTRQEFYWEHFGLMDDTDYAERTIKKLKEYAENNILPGKNLLFTMETADCPVSSRQIENLINEFLI